MYLVYIVAVNTGEYIYSCPILYWLLNEKGSNFLPNPVNYWPLILGINLLYILDGEVVQRAKANGQYSAHKTDHIIRHAEVRSRQGHQHRL